MNTATYFSKQNDDQYQLRKCISMLKAERDEGKELDKDLLLAKLEGLVVPEVSAGAKAAYGEVMQTLAKAHKEEVMGSFNMRLKGRGTKINTTTRNDVGVHLAWSQITSMIAAAVMPRFGIDPLELLIAYGRARLEVDPAAQILHLIEQACNDFEEMIPATLVEAEAMATGGSADGEEAHEEAKS